MESINWNELDHAFGEASDIPDLLKRLESYPSCEKYDEEPFYTLWSSLCHQGDVYSASYAAVPYIVSIIENAPDKVNYNYFLLPLCIEIARKKGCGPEIEEELKDAYLDSIQKMGNLVCKLPSADENMSNVLSAVTALSFGNVTLAETIIELTPDTLEEFQEWRYNR